MSVLLDYQHVEISFNGNAVVHDVSFQVHPGEILGLVGESGSGKSTLIRAAMGLLGDSGMVTRGDIWFVGKGDAQDLRGKDRYDLSGLRRVLESDPHHRRADCGEHGGTSQDRRGRSQANSHGAV